MKLKKLLYALASIVMAVNFYSCKDEDGPYIPTVPTTFSIEDGARVEDTEIKISVSGSSVEGRDIGYRLYMGTSIENMGKVRFEVELTPYTQYFWYVTAVDLETGGISDPSTIRTFYCVPSDFEIHSSSDNGETESAIVLNWKDDFNDKFYNIRAIFEPEIAGVKYVSSVSLTDEDIKNKSVTVLSGDKYDVCTQDFDDEKGLYYEPIKYKVKIGADVQVGDKVFQVNSKEVEEVFLDKSKMVRDAQFNVYRVKKIGNRIWMVDDLRYIADEFEYSKEVTLKSGQAGRLYWRAFEYMLPNGFELPSRTDFVDLLSVYGATGSNWLNKEASSEDVEEYKYSYIDRFAQNYESKHESEEIRELYNKMIYDTEYYQYQSCDMFSKLRSKYGWYSTENGEEIEGEETDFNAKPWGVINGDKNISVNSAAFYYNTSYSLIGIWSANAGICLYGNIGRFHYKDSDGYWIPYEWYFSVRGIKR